MTDALANHLLILELGHPISSWMVQTSCISGVSGVSACHLWLYDLQSWCCLQLVALPHTAKASSHSWVSPGRRSELFRGMTKLGGRAERQKVTESVGVKSSVILATWCNLSIVHLGVSILKVNPRSPIIQYTLITWTCRRC